jgi:glycosyltransferase involved in cell wall biosynthesis
MLSVIILTHNSEGHVLRALKSASFSEDVVIIDDNSSDNTQEIAKQAGARVFTRPLQGDFSAQRNFGLAQARHDWVLFLDSDEVITPELQQEITDLLSGKPECKSYAIKRSDSFWGQTLEHGEVAHARSKGIVRLVHKRTGRWKGAVHETFHTDSSVGVLQSLILHYPHPTIKEFLSDINYYSTLRARELVQNGARVSLFHLIAYPWGKFCYTYFFKMGFRDNTSGFVYAFMMSFHSFLVRAKVIQFTDLDRG